MSWTSQPTGSQNGPECHHRPSIEVEHSSRMEAMERQVPSPPWKVPRSLGAASSGCDSSDCLYCQGMAHRRSLDGKQVCWLRRKRSENELAALAGDRSSTPSTSDPTPRSSEEGMVVPQAGGNSELGLKLTSNSMWDHALLEPEEALDMVTCSVSSAATTFSSSSAASASSSPLATGNPWAWDSHYPSLPLPVPSRLIEIGRFTAPPTARSRHHSTDITCGMEFEEHGWLLATAGVSKQVRVYSLASCLRGEDAEDISGEAALGGCSPHRDPLRVHRMASKLSSLVWNPDHPGVVTVGDYDGGVNQLDLESGHLIVEADEHSGRRVWSVSHSLVQAHLAASGADDGSVVLWSGPGLGHVAARVAPPTAGAAVTGVHLSPHDESLMAVASADCTAYLYDLRQLNTPLVALKAHTRPLSYVKFMDTGKLVTAGVDGLLATWDLAELASGGGGGGSGGGGGARPARRFVGHHNSKNFVGLSVRPEDQLVACGSEGPQVYAYSMAWETPLVAHTFANGGNKAEGGAGEQSKGAFCSAVAWQPATAAPGCGPLLAAATSDGDVRVLSLRDIRE